jgi:hypothetical protein
VCELLRFGYLSWGHPLFGHFYSLDRYLLTPCRRKTEPHVGTNIVLRHASAFGVHDSEMEHGDGMGLRGSPPKPDHCFTKVFGYASAVCVLAPE